MKNALDKLKTLKRPEYTLSSTCVSSCEICGKVAYWYLCKEHNNSALENVCNLPESERIAAWNNYHDDHTMILYNEHGAEWMLFNGYVRNEHYAWAWN